MVVITLTSYRHFGADLGNSQCIFGMGRIMNVTWYLAPRFSSKTLAFENPLLLGILKTFLVNIMGIFGNTCDVV